MSHVMVAARVCEQCGIELVRRDNEGPSDWRKRKFCGQACAWAAQRTPTPELDNRPCPTCGEPLKRRHGESLGDYRSRVYCSKSCAGKGQDSRTREESEYVAGEVEHLLTYGSECAERIAGRLGYGILNSLTQRLRDNGRTDLAQRLLARSIDRAVPCGVCGRPVKPSLRDQHQCIGYRNGW